MKTLIISTILASFALGQQITIPEGTKIRVRLDQTITSATADEGQTVELSVTEPIRVGGIVVVAEGARVTGTITQAREKRRMGRAGKLDFSIDRVRAADDEWVPLRYTMNKKSGESHSVRTGVITAGAAVVFWPVAPVFLLMKGKDVTINKGVAFEVFTDNNHILASTPQAPGATTQIASNQQPKTAPATAAGPSASVSITSVPQGAEILVDGALVGSTPTIVQLAPGPHQISIRSGAKVWERVLQVTGGSQITLNAPLS